MDALQIVFYIDSNINDKGNVYLVIKTPSCSIYPTWVSGIEADDHEHAFRPGFYNDLDQTILQQIVCPTLILHSENGNQVPVSHALKNAKDKIKNAKLATFNNRWGHMLWFGNEYQPTCVMKLKPFLWWVKRSTSLPKRRTLPKGKCCWLTIK